MLNREKIKRIESSCASLAKTLRGLHVCAAVVQQLAGESSRLFVVLLMFYSKIQTATDSSRGFSPSSWQLNRFETLDPLLLTLMRMEPPVLVTNAHDQSNETSSKILSLLSLSRFLGHSKLLSVQQHFFFLQPAQLLPTMSTLGELTL